MRPQIVPSKFADCRSLKDTMDKIRKWRGKPKSKEQIAEEGNEKKRILLSEDGAPNAKRFKWSRSAFRCSARGDELPLRHWKRESDRLDRSEHFSKFNCKTPLVKYKNHEEYYSAGLDKLPSSSSWSKIETDCLMELCERFDLRFGVVADRFMDTLKEQYGLAQVAKLNLEHLC